MTRMSSSNPSGEETPLGGEEARAKACPNCGADMEAAQDWCLKCGAMAQERVRGRPGWRSAAAAISASAVLALGAAAAAYAALNQKEASAPQTQQTVAEAPPTTTTETPPAETPTTPETPEVPEGSTSEAGALPATPTAPPSLPSGPTAAEEQEEQKAFEELEAEEEAQRKGGEQTGTTGEEEAEAEVEEGEAGEEATEEEPPMLLDTNASHVYNPYSYPESLFGDPTLAIDGEATTAFRVKVREEAAPKMADGLLINMKALTSVKRITLITNTPGFTLQVYGTKQKKKPPETITSKGWTKLTGSHVAKKHTSTVNLHKSKQQFRQILVWFVKAPESSTPEAPGHVAINELELYETP